MDREAGGGAEPLLLRMTRDHPVEVRSKPFELLGLD